MLVPMHTGTQSSDLRLYVEDDATDLFSIWGGSCRSNCHDITASARLAEFSLDHQYLRGNVGIGTRSPSQKLSVTGTVLAEEVIVKPQSDWADVVFEDGYDLPTLGAVSSFIDESHLPDVPSAETIRREGLRLGKMDATLLQKGEELTLYAIKQKHRADRQRRRADSLSRQVNALRKTIETGRQVRRTQQRQINSLKRQLDEPHRRLTETEK
jgi:hypothetical protein